MGDLIHGFPQNGSARREKKEKQEQGKMKKETKTRNPSSHRGSRRKRETCASR
jgi:hypothetical protein